MSKPNFWRLKRKAKDKAGPSVRNPPKITQKTISSFFGGSSQASNLNQDAVVLRLLYKNLKNIKNLPVLVVLMSFDFVAPSFIDN